MSNHLDIFPLQFNKTGEELCGDTIRIQRAADKTLVVLSDGLGSGVKANILSTMTAGILLTMLMADAPLDETVRTVIGTLPVCQVRHLAYATFTVVRIQNATGEFDVANFDNPRIVWIKGRKLQLPLRASNNVHGRDVFTFRGTLEPGDFLGIFSDGMVHAGMGKTMNLGWGWESVARYIEESAQHYCPDARSLVQRVMQNATRLYGEHFGDDTSMIGVLTREHRRLSVFTGPPLNRDEDENISRKFLNMPGRHVVCGGTTGNIIGRHLDETPEVVLSSMRPEIPPYGRLREVNLVTEGILTMNKALELVESVGSVQSLPDDENAAVLLARELLQADSIHFIVGQRINDFYQNPDLPKNLSLRRGLVNELVAHLRAIGKEVELENC